MAGRKRSRAPQWSDVRGRLHMRVKEVAAELKVPVAYLRHLCHQNGYPTWPGKRIRYMKSIGEIVLPEVDAPEGSSRAGLARPSLLAMIAEMNKKEEDMTRKKKQEEDMTRIQAAPVANPPPGHGELITLNLIDKVGLSPSSEST